MQNNIQLPWGLDVSEVKPNSLDTISSTKIEKFQMGLHKKSRFQRAKEEKESKEREESEAAAAIYGDFVKSFESEPESSKSKAPVFVKSGYVAPESTIKSSNIYKPEKKGGSEMSKLLEEMKVGLKVPISLRTMFNIQYCIEK
jgi:hypothetical protein